MQVLRSIVENENLVLTLTFLSTTVLAVLFFNSEYLKYLAICVGIVNLCVMLFDKKMILGFNNGIILMGIASTLALLIFLFHEVLDFFNYIGPFAFFQENGLYIKIVVLLLFYSQIFLSSSFIVGRLVHK